MVAIETRYTTASDTSPRRDSGHDRLVRVNPLLIGAVTATIVDVDEEGEKFQVVSIPC